MKVKAKCNLKYGSRWIQGGEVLEVSDQVYFCIRDMVEIVNDDPPVVVAEEEPVKEPEPAPADSGDEEQPKPKTARTPRRTSSTKK